MRRVHVKYGGRWIRMPEHGIVTRQVEFAHDFGSVASASEWVRDRRLHPELYGCDPKKKLTIWRFDLQQVGS